MESGDFVNKEFWFGEDSNLQKALQALTTGPSEFSRQCNRAMVVLRDLVIGQGHQTHQPRQRSATS